MPGRERSLARAALSRLPRWVTALGIVLLVAELTGAALLAAGPHRGAGNHGRTPTATGNGGQSPTATGNGGRTHTVVLRVDGAPLANDRCVPVPPASCGPEVGYGTYGTALDALTPVPRPARLPFIRKIQVAAGQSVGLNAWSGTDSPLTCSITVDGSVLSRITALTPNGDETSAADCHTTVPDSTTAPGAARRTAVLRIDSVPNATCRQGPSGCFPGVVWYTAPTGGASGFSAAVPLDAEIPVPAGGTVSLQIAAAGEDLATCSITMNGRTLSQDTNHGYLGVAFCQATVP